VNEAAVQAKAVVGYCLAPSLTSHQRLISMRPFRTAAQCEITTSRCPIISLATRTRRSRSPTSKIKQASSDSPLHVYAGAGHGFNCDERSSYSAKDAKLAFERSIEFLNAQLD
jgi:carboxymethylenebutenolidase